MRTAMARDARLREAVEHAASLRVQLRRLGDTPAPPSLRRRLLSALPGEPMLPLVSWGSAAVAALLVAGVLFALMGPGPLTGPGPEQRQEQIDARVAALREFELAMTYIQRSSVIAREQVKQAVGSGLREALETSRRKAFASEDDQQENGG